MLYERLTDEGYYVVMSAGTDGAKDWALRSDASKIDMIISDQRMPKEHGTSFLSFLTELEKSDPEKLDQNSSMFQEIRSRFKTLNDGEFIEMLRSIKARPCIRVILSGYAEDQDINKALSAGVIHQFISKESEPREILDTIGQLFKRHQQ